MDVSVGLLEALIRTKVRHGIAEEAIDELALGDQGGGG